MSEIRQVKVVVYDEDGVPLDEETFLIEPWVNAIECIGVGKFTALDKEECHSSEGARLSVGYHKDTR